VFFVSFCSPSLFLPWAARCIRCACDCHCREPTTCEKKASAHNGIQLRIYASSQCSNAARDAVDWPCVRAFGAVTRPVHVRRMCMHGRVHSAHSTAHVRTLSLPPPTSAQPPPRVAVWIAPWPFLLRMSLIFYHSRARVRRAHVDARAGQLAVCAFKVAELSDRVRAEGRCMRVHTTNACGSRLPLAATVFCK
jgi:hypothetical protein